MLRLKSKCFAVALVHAGMIEEGMRSSGKSGTGSGAISVGVSTEDVPQNHQQEINNKASEKSEKTAQTSSTADQCQQNQSSEAGEPVHKGAVVEVGSDDEESSSDSAKTLQLDFCSKRRRL